MFSSVETSIQNYSKVRIHKFPSTMWLVSSRLLIVSDLCPREWTRRHTPHYHQLSKMFALHPPETLTIDEYCQFYLCISSKGFFFFAQDQITIASNSDREDLEHHDDVIKWKHFPRYWPFVRGIHQYTVEFPAQRPVTRSFVVFFDLRQNKLLSKKSLGRWFETPSHSLWRHCNDAQHPGSLPPGQISDCPTLSWHHHIVRPWLSLLITYNLL